MGIEIRADVRPRIAPSTAAANIAQRIGGPIGTTLLAIVLSATVADPQRPAAGAFAAAFAVLLGLQLLVLGATTRLPLRINPPRADTRA